MKAKLTLNNPLWNAPARRKILDKAVQAPAIELEGEIQKEYKRRDQRELLKRICRIPRTIPMAAS